MSLGTDPKTGATKLADVFFNGDREKTVSVNGP